MNILEIEIVFLSSSWLADHWSGKEIGAWKKIPTQKMLALTEENTTLDSLSVITSFYSEIYLCRLYTVYLLGAI